MVVDARTGDGIGWANVVLEETGQGVSSHENGEFHLLMVPSGTYTLRASHLGFRDEIRLVELTPEDTLHIDLYLNPRALSLQIVDVKGEKADTASSADNDPVMQMDGGKLQRELGLTIAETVDEEPGIAQRSMGPAPARPVMRGLSGDRLLILEDGKRTGDLSATSSDHAVAIEPMTAGKIEVIRGAETLLYGPGVMGGVVDIERGIIPKGALHRTQASVSFQSESVNDGWSGGVNLETPLSALAMKIDGSLRSTGDVKTPEGMLGNTAVKTRNAGLGLSLHKSRGMAGASGTFYESEYGIPGGFIGAHPNGVSIEMRRGNFEFMSRIYPPIKMFRQVEFSYAYAKYYHAEYESNGALGMEFGTLMDNINLKIHLREHFLFDKGVLGMYGELRDYATGGFSFTPATSERQFGFFAYEQKKLNRIHFKAAVRFDFRKIDPDYSYYDVVIGHVRKRTFSGLSSALTVKTPLYGDIVLGVNLMRSWRAPTVEELFTRGPHLAAYSYEIGNPDLKAERGFGSELFLNGRLSTLQGRITIFRNGFANYIFPSFSGRLSASRNDLYEYRYMGRDAVMIGTEANIDWDFAPRWNLHGVLSYVRGELAGSGTPMPLIPPLSGRLGVMYRICCWSINFDAIGSTKQDRLYISEDPDARPEDGTSAWIKYDFSIQMQKPWKGLLHTAVLSIDNLSNVAYRNHLSRIKAIMPEPGRNVRLIYRVYL